VAPVPGETKIWQYITLFKRISLIDCPGVVVDTAGDTETDSVLKGVVRAERLENPEDFVEAILAKVKREHIAAQYQIPKDGDHTWKDGTDLMEMIAKKSGRLLKGGEPCMRSAAIMLINDFQRGRLPHYVAPPELKEDNEAMALTASVEGIPAVQQNLEKVGAENMGETTDKSQAQTEPALHEEKEANNDDEEEEAKEAKEGHDSQSDEEFTGAMVADGDWDD